MADPENKENQLPPPESSPAASPPTRRRPGRPRGSKNKKKQDAAKGTPLALPAESTPPPQPVLTQ
ncbi:hypothetical protein PM082_024007 [Marasmius tenuissimus]|nr:hypothetical protein PM082_024007 [Marasmius tenuissimus]